MRRLIVATLVTSLVLSTVCSAITVTRWNQNVGNPAGTVTVAKSGAAPSAQYVIADCSYEEARTAMDPMTDFGIYITGCIVPPADGEYTFYTSSDDSSAFALSEDADIAKAVVIASLTGWNGADAFTTIASGTRTTGKATLKAGQPYAFYFAHQNGAAGGTNGSIGWSGPDPIGATPVVVQGIYVQALPGAVAALKAAAISTALVGTKATLSCSLPLSSFPEITSGAPTWYKKGDAGDTEVGAGFAVTIGPVTSADSGVYYAKMAGAVSNDAKLIVQSGLVHRYTFNEADVDSIIIKDVLNQEGDNAGAFDAMLYDLSGKDKFDKDGMTLGNATQSSGAANASYVDLPNGMFSSLGPQFTIETWYTQITGGIWQRIFDIGVANGGEDKSDGGGNTAYFYLCPAKGGDGDETLWYGYKTNNSAGMNNSEGNIGGQNNGGWRVPKNVEKFYAVTWDQIAGVTKMYYQGIPMGHLKTRSDIMNPAQFVDTNNWLGRSQWGDTAAGGRYNEFRVWDVALSAAEIARHCMVGPDDASLAPAGACGTLATRQTLDINGDCNVDLVDYAMLVNQWIDSTPMN